MKVLGVTSIFLTFFSLLCSSDGHSIQKRKAVTEVMKAVSNVGHDVVSLTMDMYSLVKLNEDTVGMLTKKLDHIVETLNAVTANIEHTSVLLQTVLQELSKTLYANAIIEAEREIDHCFDVLRDLTKNSNSTQATNNMKNCYSLITYVKQIGKIVTGQTLGISSDSLFDLLIKQQKSCNGTEIVGIQSYLSQLLMKGCSAVIFAESLEYGGTSTLYKDYCMTAFNATDVFRQSLFNRCAGESCDVAQNSISKTLKSAHTADRAFYLLSKAFPWFYFMVLETPCTPECRQETFYTFGNVEYNLQTYLGKYRLYLVSYRDKRYNSSGSGDPTGFEVPQSCRISIRNDIGFGMNAATGSPTITFVMYEDNVVKLYSKICTNRKTECSGQPTVEGVTVTTGTPDQKNDTTDAASSAVTITFTVLGALLVLVIPICTFCWFRKMKPKMPEFRHSFDFFWKNDIF